MLVGSSLSMPTIWWMRFIMFYVIANRNNRTYDRDYDINGIESIFETNIYYEISDIIRNVEYDADIDARDFINYEMSYYKFEAAFLIIKIQHY